MANNTCRICLATNIRMHNIQNTTYSLVYERNTGCELSIRHGGPDTICLYCNMSLIKFARFLNMSQKAEKYHSETVIDLTDDSSGVTINRDKPFHNLGSTDTQCISLNSETNFKEDVFDMKPVIKRRTGEFIEDVAVKIERVDCNEFEMFQEMPIAFKLHSEDDDDDDDGHNSSIDYSGMIIYYESEHDHDHTYAFSKRDESTFNDKSKTHTINENISTDSVNGGSFINNINEENIVNNVNGQNDTNIIELNIVTNINKENVLTSINGENDPTDDNNVTNINEENVVTIISEENVAPKPINYGTVATHTHLVNKESVNHTVFSMKTRRRHYSELNSADRAIQGNANKVTRLVNTENEHVNVIALPEIRIALEPIPTAGITPAKPKRRPRPRKDTKSNHSHATRLSTKKPPYSCYDCDFVCFIKKKLHSHIRSAHEISTHSCKVCLQKFSSVQQLSKHVKMKHKTMDCLLCGKEMTTVFSYRRHMRLHAQTDLYQCETCHRAFKHRSMYLVHARTHTGEKPFKCKWCDRAFNDKSNCRKHMLSHEGRRQQYICALCHKNFWQKSQLKSHAIEHIV